MTNFQKNISITILSLSIVFSGYLIAFAWTAPTIAPPGGNISAPLNVGSVAQTKTGDLTLDGQFIGATGFRIRPNSGSSYFYINPGTSGGSAYISWMNSANQRLAYLGYSNTDLAVNLENSADFVVNGGNVGIGLTNPYYALTFPNDEILSFNNDASNPFGMSGGSNSRLRIFAGNSTAYNIQFGSYAPLTDSFNEVMRIQTNGNVGIGTTDPSSKLEVAGDIELQGSGASSVILKNANGSYNDSGISFDYSSWTHNGSIWLSDTFVLNMAGHTGLRFYTNSLNQGGTGNIRLSMDWNNTMFYTSTDASNPIETMRLTAGKVGIGTTAPNKLLHLKTASGNAELDIQSVSSPYWGIYQDDASDDLRFWNVDDRMTITNEGNVGIGTTAPTAKLHIDYGSTYQLLLTSPNSAGQKLYMGSIWSTVGTFIGGNNYYHTSWTHMPTHTAASGIYFYPQGEIALYADTGLTEGVAYNPSERVIIKNNGNVGIGTTAPLAGLQITRNYTDSLNNNLRLTGNIPGISFDLPSGTANRNFGIMASYNTGGQLDFTYSSAAQGNPTNTLMVLDGLTGNLGIGTTAPAAKLHIHNSTPSQSNTALFLTNDNSWAVDEELRLDFGNDPSAVLGRIALNTEGALDWGFNFYTTNSGTFNSSPSVTFSGDGDISTTGDLTVGDGLDITGTVNMFGAWESKAVNTTYQAPSDGFVIVHVLDSTAVIYTDSSTPPTTLRVYIAGLITPGDRRGSGTIPVRKGDYWKVAFATGSSATVWWMSLGQ
jgi:hypothetical protein